MTIRLGCRSRLTALLARGMRLDTTPVVYGARPPRQVNSDRYCREMRTTKSGSRGATVFSLGLVRA